MRLWLLWFLIFIKIKEIKMRLVKVNSVKKNEKVCNFVVNDNVMESIDKGYKVEFNKSDIGKLESIIKSLSFVLKSVRYMCANMLSVNVLALRQHLKP